VLMGGRAAEALIFDGEVSTGASRRSPHKPPNRCVRTSVAPKGECCISNWNRGIGQLISANRTFCPWSNAS
jgi:hypothetical protein